MERTCLGIRLLRKAAQPLRYHSLEIDQEEDRMLWYIEALSKQPDLGEAVSDVGWRMSSEPAEYTHLVEQLLQLTPNVKHAHLRMLTDVSFEALEQPNVSLPLLRDLVVFDYDGGVYLDRTSAIIQLAPDLKLLRSHGRGEVTAFFSGSLRQEGLRDWRPLQNVTELCLTSASLTATSLRNLLTAVGQGLKKVYIRPLKTSPPTPKGQSLNLDEALAALQPWSQTLEKYEFYGYKWKPLRPTRILRALREFEALKFLRTDGKPFGVEMDSHALASDLPSSMRTIRFVQPSGGLDIALRALLGAFLAGKFPRLSKGEVDQEMSGESTSTTDQRLRQLSPSFVSKELKLDLSNFGERLGLKLSNLVQLQ